ncbi:MAG: hypothetical protein NVS2B7_17880 [Herpetosiphon sp.]
MGHRFVHGLWIVSALTALSSCAAAGTTAQAPHVQSVQPGAPIAAEGTTALALIATSAPTAGFNSATAQHIVAVLPAEATAPPLAAPIDPSPLAAPVVPAATTAIVSIRPTTVSPGDVHSAAPTGTTAGAGRAVTMATTGSARVPVPSAAGTATPRNAPTQRATVLQSVPTAQRALSASAEVGSTAAPTTTSRQTAPDFDIISLAGEHVRLSDFHGRPVMLTFFATTCGPCKQELPLIQRLKAQYQDQLTVLLVSVFEDADTVRPFAQQLKLTDMRILPDGLGAAALNYDLTTVPTTLFIDRTGRIVDRTVGAVGQAQLQTGLARLGLGQRSGTDHTTQSGPTGTPAFGCPVGGC